DHNLLHLQPAGLDSVKWQMTLIDHTAGASWNALSLAASPEDALAMKARYEKLPCVERVIEIASLVPAQQQAKLPMLAAIQRRLRRRPPRGDPILHPAPPIDALLDKTNRVLGELQHKWMADNFGWMLAQVQGNVQSLRDALARADSALASTRLQNFDDRLTR